VASNRPGLIFAAALILVTGACKDAAKEQATLDSIANVQLMARRDSAKKAKATRDSLAVVKYATCSDSTTKALRATAAGRRALNKKPPAGATVIPEITTACGPNPVAPAAAAAAAPATTPAATAARPGTAPATTPNAAAPKPAAPAAAQGTAPAGAAAPTAQQLRVQRQDSIRQARERAKQDSLSRVAERRRTDSLAQVKADSARADSLARAKETEVLRETFAYSGANRDPFQSVIANGTSGPDVGDLQLVAIYADVRSARNSIAILRERQGTRRWRVKIGDKIGTATVTLITGRDVTFNIQDFGFERQETLSLRKPSEDTP
jgi:hypothetical protein